MSQHIQLGQEGEDLAANFLRKKGFKLLERNLRTIFGEIDLICLDSGVVVFTEVKTRRTDRFGRPSESIGWQKRRRLSRAAMSYLMKKHWEDRPARFDVVEISFTGSEPRINHLPDAFDFAGN